MADDKYLWELDETLALESDDIFLVGVNQSTVPETKYLSLVTLLKNNYEYGSKMVWNSTTGYSVTAGRKLVNGKILTWTSDINRSGLSLTASTLYNAYLYDNSGTPAVEESTTVPQWDPTYRYWRKTGDASRRFLGTLYSNSSSNIIRFLCELVNNRSLEYYYIPDDPDFYQTPFLVVNGGSSSASWANINLSSTIPPAATHWYANVKLEYTSNGDDAVVGMSPVDLGASQGAGAGLSTFRVSYGGASKRAFFGSTFFPIQTAQTYYYRLNVVTGTVVAYIESKGYKFYL